MSEEYTVATADGELTFIGRLLGRAENRAVTHSHSTSFARRGERCSACRWSEYRIYRVAVESRDATGGRYVVLSYGHSDVPNERTIHRVSVTDSPAEVIELLTTRKFNQAPQLTATAARLLARASDLDDDLQDAWDNRVVL